MRLLFISVGIHVPATCTNEINNDCHTIAAYVKNTACVKNAGTRLKDLAQCWLSVPVHSVQLVACDDSSASSPQHVWSGT